MNDMIDSKLKLKQYIKMDLEANKQTGKIMKSEIARLLVYLRYIEFYTNCSKGIISPILRYYYKYRYHRLSVHTGISIGINSFGPGLTIPHYGSIVVNSSARFGSRIVLQNGVNISENASGGDHIYFGAGSKVMRNIKLGSDIIVGANAVVTKDFIEDDIVIAGIPAVKISDHGYKNRSQV